MWHRAQQQRTLATWPAVMGLRRPGLSSCRLWQGVLGAGVCQGEQWDWSGGGVGDTRWEEV